MKYSTCEVCGKQFEPNRYHPHQRFCSVECRKKWEGQNQYNPKPCICSFCGKEYVPKKSNRNQYCSRECAFADMGAHRGIMPVFVQVCLICGKHITRGAYCSDECRKESKRRKATQYEIENHIDMVCRCKECGKEFIPEYGNKRRGYCCEEHSRVHLRRVSKATRRARIRDAGRIDSIDPFVVFKRDKWRCHICGVHTPKRLRGTHDDNAPELDHVIPLAKGGSHIYDNVACCCRRCNQKKSDQVIGQLGLWAERQWTIGR